MNLFCQPPKYLLGESFIGFLVSFESFRESTEAPDAAKRHAFLAILQGVKLIGHSVIVVCCVKTKGNRSSGWS